MMKTLEVIDSDKKLKIELGQIKIDIHNRSDVRRKILILVGTNNNDKEFIKEMKEIMKDGGGVKNG